MTTNIDKLREFYKDKIGADLVDETCQAILKDYKELKKKQCGLEEFEKLLEGKPNGD